MGTGAGGPSTPRDRAVKAVRELHPAYFAYVMATGIISTAGFAFGPSWLSLALLAAACAGLAVLGAAFIVRLIYFRPSVAADIQAADRVFGFFTITAGLDVLGVRFVLAGHPMVTAVLAVIAAAIWLLLTYGVPVSLLTRDRGSVLDRVDGSWLLWIVATQSLSVAAGILIPAWPTQSDVLAPVAAGMWSVGVIIYLVVITLILVRWFTVPLTPAAFGPAYWILMGATAISVLAGARYLALPADIPVVRATSSFIEGFTYALWAVGTWWIPLLIVLESWRHIRRHWPLAYEPTFWSIVFPLGMYSVATQSFGEVVHLSFMEPIARFMFWVSVAAWVLVGAASLARHQEAPSWAASPGGAAPGGSPGGAAPPDPTTETGPPLP